MYHRFVSEFKITYAKVNCDQSKHFRKWEDEEISADPITDIHHLFIIISTM